MESGLRSIGKPLGKLPSPTATALRFYSTTKSRHIKGYLYIYARAPWAALNNLGSAHYDMDNYAEAKSAWEKALLYLPEDQMVRENLYHFIHNNPSVPEEIREISPFIERYWNKE